VGNQAESIEIALHIFLLHFAPSVPFKRISRAVYICLSKVNCVCFAGFSILSALGLVKRTYAKYPIERRTETTPFGIFPGLAPVTPSLRALF